MAEEEGKKEKGKAEDVGQSPAKKGSLKLIIIILSTLLILAGGGAFVWFKFISPAIGTKDVKKANIEGEEEKDAKDTNAILGPMYPLDSFIVNLADSEGKRFLKVTIELELSNEEVKEEVTKRMPQIKDTALTLLSSKSFDDVYLLEGKFKVREELITRLNTLLKTGKVKNAFFTEFVIQ